MNKSILIVDDDKDIVAAMSTYLQDEFKVPILTALDGNEAIEVFEREQPAIVVLDQMLPKKSGFLVFEKIRRGKTLPWIIMITGNPGRRHQQYAESIGVNQYMFKPFRMEKLKEAIQKAIGQEALRDVFGKENST